MRAIVTGGGTGGHIYPALAVLEKIQNADPENAVLYVGSYVGMEKDIVPGKGFNYKFINAEGFEAHMDLKGYWKTVKNITRAFFQSRKIIKEFKPDVIVGTGGFAPFPIVLMGHIMGVKTYIHEQNALAGRANKALAKNAEAVFLGLKNAAPMYQNAKRLIFTGNPVRQAFFDVNREDARKALGFKDDEFAVFLFGGSQGAPAINKMGLELVKALNGTDVKLIYVTGPAHYDKAMAMFEEAGITPLENIIFKDYVNNMNEYLNACDLVIGRSGALSLAEITVCGRPSILIPSPNVVGNHQYHNAKEIEENGAAVVIEEKDLDGSKVAELILEIKNDPERAERMHKAALECAPVDALNIIYDTIKEDLSK